ncbi:MAG: RNA polymerase sigma factor, partial [Planctomycetota bacterium]
MTDDAALLQQYAKVRDADAFAELVRRYAGMVYAVCLRTTGSPQAAEDVAQDCFLELARSAGSVTSSLAGWLHALARSRSTDVVRSAATRRRHEELAMKEKASRGEPAWAQVSLHVDGALAKLPEELRAPVILHYLAGRTQVEAAQELGVNQSTIQRRLKKGVDELRERLRRAGVIVPAALLAVLLVDNAAQAAPPALVASLGKMAIAGVGKAGAVGATAKAAAAGLGALKAKLIVGAVVFFN